jgi:hypothetical protein
MKKLDKNRRKKIFTKDYVSLSTVEFKSSEDNKIDKLTDINYDLGHIYGSW